MKTLRGFPAIATMALLGFAMLTAVTLWLAVS
jgi:hypothetical protein